MKMFFVEGEVHKQLANGAYRVKVKVLNPELALYINGMVVFPASDKFPEWTVYTPKAGNARIIEFAKSSTLWEEIQEACIDAVKLHTSNQRMDQVVDMTPYDNLSREEFDKRMREDMDEIFPDAE